MKVSYVVNLICLDVFEFPEKKQNNLARPNSQAEIKFPGKEESLEYTMRSGDTISGGYVTGNFGGNYSTFNVDKLMKQKDTGYRKTNSSILKNQVIIYEEEKRLNEEKSKLAESVSSHFRNFEKVFKSFKKHQSLKQTITHLPETVKNLQLFESL